MRWQPIPPVDSCPSRQSSWSANTGANLQPGPIEYDEASAEDRRRPADVRSTSVETTSTQDRCQVQRLVRQRYRPEFLEPSMPQLATSSRSVEMRARRLS